jgi:hypothetical protein
MNQVNPLQQSEGLRCRKLWCMWSSISVSSCFRKDFSHCEQEEKEMIVETHIESYSKMYLRADEKWRF